MSTNLQKRGQTRAEPNPEAGWPQWIADALAYKPENQAPELDSLAKAVAADKDERRDIRTLSRVLGT